MNPIVSIIVPCYNQAEFLDESLMSVLNQTYQHWECFIVDDGSSDNTKEIVKKWVEKDSRINYLYQENNGVCSARNFGIRNSNGEFILPLDADDYLSENYLETCVAGMRDSHVKISYGKVKCFGQSDDLLDLGIPSMENLLIKNRIPCSGMYRKVDWLANDGYDINMHYGFEDWEFWIQILKRGGVAKKMDSCTLYYRIKSLSRSTRINTDANAKRAMIEYVFNKHLELYGYNSPYHIYREKQEVEYKLENLPAYLSYRKLYEILIEKLKRSFNRK